MGVDTPSVSTQDEISCTHVPTDHPGVSGGDSEGCCTVGVVLGDEDFTLGLRSP